MENIDGKTLKQKINNNEQLTIIDVRSNEDFEKGHINGAVNIPMMTLGMEAENLDNEKPVVVYCRTGKKSVGASLFLEDMGFKVYNLKGGYGEYINS